MMQAEISAGDRASEGVRSNLVYGLNDQPPPGEALLVALQHVCAILIPVVTPGLLITSALGVSGHAAIYIMGMSLFVSGLGTLIQCYQVGPIGSGLLSVQGTSFAFVTPILAVVDTALNAGKTPEEALSLVLGLCFFGSLIPIGMSRCLHLTRRIFTPLVSGTAVTLIGLCLLKEGMFYMAGGAKAKAIAITMPDSPMAFGSLQNWALALLVFAVVGICSATSNRYLRMGSVIIGLVAGSGVAMALGMADFRSVGDLPWVNLPRPFQLGLDFDLAAFLSFAIVYITLTLEVLGDLTATSLVSGEPIVGPIYMKRLKAGVLGDGINSLIAASCGTFPVVTPAQNNGIIQLTGVGSRYVGYYIAAILMGLGLCPVLVGGLLALPTAVVGGALMLMFGRVVVAGWNIIQEIDMDNRQLVILAISLATGLGVTFFPEVLAPLPTGARSVLQSGICTGSLCALGLSLMMPLGNHAAVAGCLEGPTLESVPLEK
jgi:xanthine permease XanP